MKLKLVLYDKVLIRFVVSIHMLMRQVKIDKNVHLLITRSYSLHVYEKKIYHDIALLIPVQHL